MDFARLCGAGEIKFSTTSKTVTPFAGLASFIVVHETQREDKDSVGRRLLDVPGYTFRISVTNRTEPPEELWRDYNQRATFAASAKTGGRSGHPVPRRRGHSTPPSSAIFQPKAAVGLNH